VTNPLPNPLHPEELSQLHELREVLLMASTPGWQIVLRRMKEDAEEAREALIGAAYASDNVLAGLARRWQQREAVFRGVLSYIQNCEETKSLLLENSNQGVPLDAERYQEAG
jgi:hypothetical protein